MLNLGFDNDWIFFSTGVTFGIITGFLCGYFWSVIS